MTIYRLLKEKVESEFGDYVFSTIISKSVVVSEAEAGGLPVTLREPESPAAQAYRNFAEEVMDRLSHDVGTLIPMAGLAASQGN